MSRARAMMSLMLLSLMSIACAQVPTAENEARDEVDLDTIASLDAYWPYSVGLTQTVTPPGADSPLRIATRGVLIRIEPRSSESHDRARIDFGRHGIHAVPVESTDILSQARRIRAGEDKKLAPNFALSIGRVLADPRSERLVPIRYRDLMTSPWVLCVSGDPTLPAFREHTAPAFDAAREKNMPIVVFPVGSHADADVRAALNGAGLSAPFVYKRFAQTMHAATFGDAPLPVVFMLQTHEGRIASRTSSARELAQFVRTHAPDQTAVAD